MTVPVNTDVILQTRVNGYELYMECLKLLQNKPPYGKREGADMIQEFLLPYINRDISATFTRAQLVVMLLMSGFDNRWGAAIGGSEYMEPGRNPTTEDSPSFDHEICK